MKNIADIIEKTDWKKVGKITACAIFLYIIGRIANKTAASCVNHGFGYYCFKGMDYGLKLGAVIAGIKGSYIVLCKKRRRLM